jgi:hypothetical protein
VAPSCASRATALRVFGRSRLTRATGRTLERAIRSRPRRGTNTVIVGPARGAGVPLPRGEAWVFDRGAPVLRLRPHGWRAFLGTRRRGRFREWSVSSATQVYPHDIWPAGDGTVWYTAQFRGAAGRLDAATCTRRGDPARRRVGAARRGRGCGRQCVDHGPGARRDRPRRPDDRGRHRLPDPGAGLESQHRRVRPARHPLVHRRRRVLRAGRSGDGARRRLAGRARRRHRDDERAVRDHGHARRHRLVRLPPRLTDFSTNTIQRFDPETEHFQAYRIPTTDALVRQIVEVGGVIWGAESATEKLIAYSTAG